MPPPLLPPLFALYLEKIQVSRGGRWGGGSRSGSGGAFNNSNSGRNNSMGGGSRNSGRNSAPAFGDRVGPTKSPRQIKGVEPLFPLSTSCGLLGSPSRVHWALYFAIGAIFLVLAIVLQWLYDLVDGDEQQKRSHNDGGSTAGGWAFVRVMITV